MISRSKTFQRAINVARFVLIGAILATAACSHNAQSILPVTAGQKATAPIKPQIFASSGGECYQVLDDGTWIYSGPNPDGGCGPTSGTYGGPGGWGWGFGGGGGGGGGSNPPPLTNDPTGCDADESLCDMTPGDVADALAYSDGYGGNFTHYPWGCTPSSDLSTVSPSTVDGLPCSTWQIYHYYDLYCKNSSICKVVGQIGFLDHIFVEIGPAGSSDINVPGAGHLYVQPYVLGLPFGEPIQGGQFQGQTRAGPFYAKFGASRSPLSLTGFDRGR